MYEVNMKISSLSSSMKAIYSNEDIPSSFVKSVFLAGPTYRGGNDKSWRYVALDILKEIGYDGVVFLPEYQDMSKTDYTSQVEWEKEAMRKSDCIVFWVPRDMRELPGLTTNCEYGEWFKSGKVILGYPEDAEKMRYLQKRGEEEFVPTYSDLKTTLKSAVDFIGSGAERSQGECGIPYYIWKTDTFQSWYSDLKQAGNRLDDATLLWVYRVGSKKSIPFSFAFHVDVYISDEDRNKVNEFVLFRSNISSILLYYPAENILNTKVILVREFRSPVSNEDGYVYELPGGSSFKEGVDPKKIAADEVKEELDLDVRSNRFEIVTDRQMVPTFASYKSTLFKLELKKDELSNLEKDTNVHGLEEDSERTYIEVFTVEKIISGKLVGWADTGMILSVLM